ncbi:hypothetical protein F5Y16DRAFT_398987 [Xylariaceae sp. FL0255]|nr:hypothetical protein F5Y16DRAFT_398987 [Xylariaceae sp. FL0255]
MTNLGPLPTTFELASSCMAELDTVYKVFTVETNFYYLLQGPVTATTCYPSGYAANTAQYYSPALCPTGFTSACQSLNQAGDVTETVVKCCPTQYNLQCNTDSASYPWQSTLGCTNPVNSASTTAWTVQQVSDSATDVTTSNGYIGGINAYSIEVRHQSSDFMSTSTTTTATESSSSTLTGGGTSNSGGSQSSSDRASNNKYSGLSTGAIAGIAIGVALVAIIAIGGAIALMLKKRGANKAQSGINGASGPYDQPRSMHGSQPPMSRPRTIASPMQYSTRVPASSWGPGTPSPAPHMLPQGTYYDPPKPTNATVYEMPGTHVNAVEMPTGNDSY